MVSLTSGLLPEILLATKFRTKSSFISCAILLLLPQLLLANPPQFDIPHSVKNTRPVRTMAATASSEALVPSQDENRTGWNSLPDELKLEIFEHITNPDGWFFGYDVSGPPGFCLHGRVQAVEYSWKDIPWAIRALSKRDCMIYEQVIKKSLENRNLCFFVDMPFSNGENTPLEINDNIYCIPDLRSSTSRPTTWYMRSWCGVAIAAAFEAFEARIETSASIFSFDIARLEPIVTQVLDRTRKGMIREMSRHPNAWQHCEFRGYVQNAFAFLRLEQTVKVVLTVQEFDGAAPVDHINLIHDLRYFADNSLLEVEVQVEFGEDDHEKWTTWLQAVGGQIKWLFNTKT